MRKVVLLAAGSALAFQHASAKRVCGIEIQRQAIIAQHPEAAEKFEKERQSLQKAASDFLKNRALQKTSATASPIPVIFHVLLDSAQFNQIGGITGITRRCDSQIAVLNRDYNRQNSDSTLIPAGFKAVYGSAGIRYGLAHTAPNGHGTPGYEVKFISAVGWSGATEGYKDAKYASSGGLDSWDVAKYLNVWVINFSDVPGLLGITTPKSFAGSGTFTLDQSGVCIAYGAFGKRAAISDYYISAIDQGRTLTHEFGHFFTLRHTWGDDGGACPGSPGGTDDGFTDTPPEADATFGSPTLPKYDSCSSTGAGVMCMNFMDYTDDKAMQMFTQMQAAAIAANVASGGQNYTLTQNPALLEYPTGIEPVQTTGTFSMYPNPTNGIVTLTIDEPKAELNKISIINMIGEEVMTVVAPGSKNIYSIDLSGMSKGIYLVRCTFATGSVTRKILLQ